LSGKLERLLKEIREPDKEAMEKAREHWLNIAKPLKSFGKFEDLIVRIAGIRGEAGFSLEKRSLIVMCADNGVVAEGVTQTGQHMTRVVSENFLKGDTSACRMAEYAGVEVIPVDIGVREDISGLTDPLVKVRCGTGNIAREDAMTREEAEKAVLIGIDSVRTLKEKGCDLIATGEMGIGNTTVSSVLTAFLLGREAEEVTGRGAGLSEEGLARKTSVVKAILNRHSPDRDDPIDILSKIGGLDIAGLTGVFLGGAVYRIPVIIDGFISAVAALLAFRMNRLASEYMLPSHSSKEGGAGLILKELALSPLIEGEMFTGEGCGALMLIPLLDMVLKVYNEMITFDSLSGKERYRFL